MLRIFGGVVAGVCIVVFVAAWAWLLFPWPRKEQKK